MTSALAQSAHTSFKARRFCIRIPQHLLCAPRPRLKLLRSHPDFASESAPSEALPLSTAATPKKNQMQDYQVRLAWSSRRDTPRRACQAPTICAIHLRVPQRRQWLAITPAHQVPGKKIRKVASDKRCRCFMCLPRKCFILLIDTALMQFRRLAECLHRPVLQRQLGNQPECQVVRPKCPVVCMFIQDTSTILSPAFRATASCR